MLDAFEIRTTDLLADVLAGAPGLGPVGRFGSVSEPSAGETGIALRVVSATANTRVGDDQRERLGPRGDIRLRPVLFLEGEMELVLTLAPPPPPQASTTRALLIGMLDRVLLALHGEATRSGRAFLTADDLGFELDGFRLSRVGPVPEAEEDPLRVALIYGFSGRFWPVETPAEGGLIETIPTRLAVMPVEVPGRVMVQAGAADIVVPIRLDLTTSGSASGAVAARLAGASPPGALISDGTDAPSGYQGFAVAVDGSVAIVYRPPGAVASRTDVRIETALANEDGPTINLPDLSVEVLP